MGSAKIRFLFHRRCIGEISELRFDIEPALPAAVFKKKIATGLLASDYLRKFSAPLNALSFCLEVTFNKGKLFGTISGQPACEVKPEKSNCFSVKEVPNCSMQFFTKSDGAVSELQIHQGGQVFTLQPSIC